MFIITDVQIGIGWLPDGAGPQTVPSAQKIVFRPQPGQTGVGQTPVQYPTGGWPVGPGPVGYPVPGGDAPTIANFYTAFTGTNTAPVGGPSGSLSGDICAQINAQLGRILAFASGGG